MRGLGKAGGGGGDAGGGGGSEELLGNMLLMGTLVEGLPVEISGAMVEEGGAPARVAVGETVI